MSLFSRKNISIGRAAAIVAGGLAALIAALALVPSGDAGAKAAQTVTNGRIAFKSERPPGDPSVDNSDPAFSPDGTKIAFASLEFAGNPCCQSIAVMNPDGSDRHLIVNGNTTLSGVNQEPSWSPDGTQIAFIVHLNGANQIAKVNADGSGFVPLTSFTSGEQLHPVWSPDGSKIAYASSRRGRFNIYVMNPDGTNDTQVTFGAALDPAWSPDGLKIAYADFSGGGSEIFVMDANGVNPVQLTFDDGGNEPVWSPDGTKIAFVSARDKNPEIYTMNADGSAQTRITNNLANDSWPTWQSVSPADVVVTSCDDPRLDQLTDVTGDLVVEDLPDCKAVSLSRLAAVHGSVTINDGDNNTINLDFGSLASVHGSVTINDGSRNTIAFGEGSLATVDGNVTITGGDSNTVTFGEGSLGTVDGNVTITGSNSNTITFAKGSLGTVHGNVTITDRTSNTTTFPRRSPSGVGGNLRVDSGSAVDLGGTRAAGDIVVSARGSVSATTAGRTTDVTVFDGTASMHVVLPDGAFDQPVAFTIERQADTPAEPGTAVDGSPAVVDPVASYRFAFAVPTLNQDAQLAFTIDLAGLDDATRAALLAGFQDGSATIAVKGDAPDATYQAFARCTQVQTPETDGCVDAALLGPDGQPAPDGTDPAFVRFTGIAGHFSTYAVALVSAGVCEGDCDGNGHVTVDELIKGVNIALGTAPLSDCRQFACHMGSEVSVDCIVRAVSAALNSVCFVLPGSNPARLTTSEQVRSRFVRHPLVSTGDPTG